MIRVSVYPVAAGMSILLVATYQPRAMAAQCQALVAPDGPRTVALDGSLIRTVSADVASFAVWLPDGGADGAPGYARL